jgi:hypothetical protein
MPIVHKAKRSTNESADKHPEKPMSTSATSMQKIADDILVDLALQDGGALGALVKAGAEKWWPLIREFGIKAE